MGKFEDGIRCDIMWISHIFIKSIKQKFTMKNQFIPSSIFCGVLIESRSSVVGSFQFFQCLNINFSLFSSLKMFEFQEDLTSKFFFSTPSKEGSGRKSKMKDFVLTSRLQSESMPSTLLRVMGRILVGAGHSAVSVD